MQKKSGVGCLLLPEILGQTDCDVAKSPIFKIYFHQ